MTDASVAEVSGLLSQVTYSMEALHRARKLFEDRLAPEFSPFQFIKISEMGDSRLLAWMLDPKESHGQGDAFLKLFVRNLDIEWPDSAYQHVEVSVETSIRLPVDLGFEKNGRLDIFIKAGEHVLLVENKSNGAGDQDRQLDRYIEWLRGTGRSDTQWKIVYLTVSGDAPSPSALNVENRQRWKSQIVCLGLDERGSDPAAFGLLQWVEACQAICRADRVRIFLDEYARNLRQRIYGNSDMSDVDYLAQEVINSPKNIEAAISVHSIQDLWQRKLLEILRSDLNEAILNKSPGLTLKWDERLTNPSGGAAFSEPGFSLVLDPDSPWEYIVEIGTKKRVFNGVHLREPQADPKAFRDEAQRVKECLLKLADRSSSPPWWPWFGSGDSFCKIADDWTVNPRPWVAIKEKSMAPIIVEAATRVREVLKEGGLICEASRH